MRCSTLIHAMEPESSQAEGHPSKRKSLLTHQWPKPFPRLVGTAESIWQPTSHASALSSCCSHPRSPCASISSASRPLPPLHFAKRQDQISNSPHTLKLDVKILKQQRRDASEQLPNATAELVIHIDTSQWISRIACMFGAFELGLPRG
jgi:hypothetical protein